MPVVMPMMVPMVMMPMDFRGLDLRILLYRRGGAGIDQRQRLGALRRSGQDKQSANCSKSQKSCYVHIYLHWNHRCHAGRAVEGINPRRNADRKLGWGGECEMRLRRGNECRTHDLVPASHSISRDISQNWPRCR